MPLRRKPVLPDTIARHRSAFALSAEHGVTDFYQGVVPALVPLLVAERGYDYAHAGGVVLAATLVSSLAQPLFGVLADRGPALGRVRAVGLLLAAAGVGAVGSTASYAATCAALVLSGIGVAAYHPEAAKAVHRTGTGDRGMGWFTFGGLAGYAAGPVAAGAVLLPFGLAATPLLAVPAVAAVIVGRFRGRSPEPGGEPDGESGAQVAGLNRWREFGWLTLIIVLRSVLFYGVSTFLVLSVADRLGATPSTASLALVLFSAAGAVSTLAGGGLVERFGRLTVLRVSHVTGLLLLGCLITAPAVPIALVAAAALGAAVNLPLPVHTTLGQHYLPRNLGVAGAVTLGISVSSGGAAVPALGAFANVHGTTAALAVLLPLPALATALTAFLRDPAEQADQ
ncbi:MFS transporter [Saccharopolyspora sp. 6M]|uniref:MFS transporter n=1 Tax=Saccharopolyspora sp. 6M TaxID=2877237 RepID=UPI001CD79AF4|nr:MFS transporter [Saccharopolyspora sp. 6M]MCA1225503.1 MFS transporter [Saccharopolyspora sp. 6M]